MSALIGVPLIALGSGALVFGFRLWQRTTNLYGKWLHGHLHANRSVASPLNGASCVYGRWTITRRRLERGVNDTISGEVSSPFEFRSDREPIPVMLGQTRIVLAPVQHEAWTVGEFGLSEAAGAEVRRGFPSHIPDARYHVEHVLLVYGQPVWYEPDRRVVSDTDPEPERTGLNRGLITAIALGSLLLGAGIALW